MMVMGANAAIVRRLSAWNCKFEIFASLIFNICYISTDFFCLYSVIVIVLLLEYIVWTLALAKVASTDLTMKTLFLMCDIKSSLVIPWHLLQKLCSIQQLPLQMGYSTLPKVSLFRKLNLPIIHITNCNISGGWSKFYTLLCKAQKRVQLQEINVFEKVLWVLSGTFLLDPMCCKCYGFSQ